MPGYLDRYLAGDHEAVWAELRDLGPAIDEGPVRADAAAVAAETMKRVRSNVELIAARLRDVDYRFGFAWDPESTAPGNTDPVVGTPRPDLPRTFAELAGHGVHLPLSLRAFYEVVGSVNLVGIYVPPEELADVGEDEHWTKYFGAQEGAPDPLYVAGIDAALDEFLEGAWDAAAHSFRRHELGSPDLHGRSWFISPCPLHLYGISGGDSLSVDVSVPAADADVFGGLPLVVHLRRRVLDQAGLAWEDDPEGDFGNPLPEEIREQLLPGLQPF
jgi:hypothetical protein